MAEADISISPDARATILSKLRGIERMEDVRILFAIESGSRAWGFPSPDSDYDVRFVYAHPRDWYLSLRPGRDVIELPIEGDWDINGWDIKKALGLMIKPNPVMLEWLSSPIRYIWDDTACEKLTAFSRNISHRTVCLNHYLHYGQRRWGKDIEFKAEINLKEYFYMLRPALTLRWVRLQPEVLPPMNFQHLMAGTDLSANVTSALQDLVAIKAQSKETDGGGRIAIADDLIREEFAWARNAVEMAKADHTDYQAAADALFRDLIQ